MTRSFARKRYRLLRSMANNMPSGGIRQDFKKVPFLSISNSSLEKPQTQAQAAVRWTVTSADGSSARPEFTFLFQRHLSWTLGAHQTQEDQKTSSSLHFLKSWSTSKWSSRTSSRHATYLSWIAMRPRVLSARTALQVSSCSSRMNKLPSRKCKIFQITEVISSLSCHILKSWFISFHLQSTTDNIPSY